MSQSARAFPSLALALLLLAHTAFAQELASVAGTVRDTSGSVMPGVVVEVSSPALIETVRSTTTDSNGQYRIAGLPVGTYEMTFSLASFSTVKRQDILLTSGFTAAIDAQLTVGNVSETIWEPSSAYRATNTVGCPTTGATAAPVGCLYGATINNNNNNSSTNLLDSSDLYGERISYMDVKFGKNLRFANKRLNIGVDIYNFLNSDAVLGYINTYTLDNPATEAVEQNLWGTPSSLIAPRYARVTLQFDF